MSQMGHERWFSNIADRSVHTPTADAMVPGRKVAMCQSRHFAVQEDSKPFRVGPP